MSCGFYYGSRYGVPYYEGGGISALVPHIGDVALGGHPYLLDFSRDPAGVNFITVPLQKEQLDTSTSPGEQSINPEAFWRRLRESWHLGAGQEDADREESSPYRFWASTHLDPWTRWSICLLPETTEKLSSAATNLRLHTVGDRLYVLDGATVKFYTDIVSGAPTSVTGLPATAPTHIASDGYNVITTHGAAGVYKTNRTSTAAASHITGNFHGLAFVRGRFLGWALNQIYDISSQVVGAGPVAAPLPIYQNQNSDLTWVGMAEGSGWIYAAGYSGDKSLIYKTQVKEDGTALEQFSVAAELPHGEVVTSITGYLGRFICIGLNKGFRLAVVTGSGDLSIGVLNPTDEPVLDFEGQGQFIWYGLGNYKAAPGALTGLGRFSTEDFVNLNLLQPARASDLMVHDETANIRSIVTFQDIRVFAVDGVGIFHEATTLEPEGHFDSGLVTYGTNEAKVGLFVNLQHRNHFGEMEVLARTEDSPFISIGARLGYNQHLLKLTVGEVEATAFEFRIILRRDPSVTTEGPCLMSWLFRAQPKSEVTTMIVARLRMAPVLEGLNETDLYMDVLAEQDYIKKLHASKTVTTWSMLDRVHTVVVEDFEGQFLKLIPNTDGLGMSANESIVIKMKEVI